MMLRRWMDMSWPDFSGLDPETAVAIMPVAAVEQHGPHLPVSVDSDLNAGIIAAAEPHVSVPAYLLPQLPVGKSDEHGAYPGTLSIGAATLSAMWTDIAESVLRAGFRKIILFNSHGGQPGLVDIVARGLRVRHGALAVAASSYGLGLPEGLFDAHEAEYGIHAGDIETSMMMHLKPEAVRHDRLADFPSHAADIAKGHGVLRAEGSVGIGWMTQDLNPTGAIGNAKAASAEKGKAAVEHAGARLARLIAEVSAYPLSNLKDKPSLKDKS